MIDSNANFNGAKTVLADWGIHHCVISLIKERENVVFKVVTQSNQKFALRIHRANYHTDAQLQSEIQWMQAIQNAGIDVPEVIPTLNGNYFSHVKINGEVCQVDLFMWVDGEQLGTVEGGLGENQAHIKQVFGTIGRISGQLHNQSSNWNPPKCFDRKAWDIDGLLGEQPHWGRFWELEQLTAEQKNLLLDVRNKTRRALIEYGYHTDTYSMIHADFSPENFLCDGEKTRVIDFDDAGMGWHLFEIATALYFFQTDSHYELAYDALIEGYRSNRVLSDKDLSQLPLFMVLRAVTYLGWLHSRKSESAAQALAPMLIRQCMFTINRYFKHDVDNVT